eukprot:TRINITY_DN12974_c0_g2_i1.p1 TRINITY_DN12974_c0_g2~~TRINITY_DN12974_c0_g2_i1.p1  ORF type:complete len:187 (-),score=17.74 TRINITY_DN12974_c0_g2_i1:275-775(-)
MCIRDSNNSHIGRADCEFSIKMSKYFVKTEVLSVDNGGNVKEISIQRPEMISQSRFKGSGTYTSAEDKKKQPVKQKIAAKAFMDDEWNGDEYSKSSLSLSPARQSHRRRLCGLPIFREGEGGEGEEGPAEGKGADREVQAAEKRNRMEQAGRRGTRSFCRRPRSPL